MLIEMTCTTKHVAHIGDVRRIPIIERLIETPCALKHEAHIGDARRIPFVERLIETLCVRKLSLILVTFDVFQLSRV